MPGKLYLIPSLLGDSHPDLVLPPTIRTLVSSIQHYLVEDIRTARRFLKKMDPNIQPDQLTFFEINKRTRFDELSAFLGRAKEGLDIGVLSEAGCPGIADPGADAVKIAHQMDIEVVPLVGPSSVLLSLMASGLNGQNFTFTGYIPIQHPGRGKTIRYLESRALSDKQTQIFIETPYRNNNLVSDLLKTLRETTRLCIACDLTLETQFIKTKTVKEWKKSVPDLHKRPAIFLIGQ
ncbi:MAG TPA: SAM-dependent methyltransferase [Prolixibacteraceae bacterium]|nr:SAM-dependent methyltransferase [Prolixibacteraceae bacterium]